MARTPFIAGNWKMHKTVAEAEAFIQALLPRVSTAEGVDVLQKVLPVPVGAGAAGQA
jgi:triosephosphate isomerase